MTLDGIDLTQPIFFKVEDSKTLSGKCVAVLDTDIRLDEETETWGHRITVQVVLDEDTKVNFSTTTANCWNDTWN